MIISTRLALVCAICVGSPLILFAADATLDDPRYTTVDYRGSGLAERAPEFGEAFFDFHVACRASANDVRAVIEGVSGPIWGAILKEVPVLAESTADFVETRARFAGETGNIVERPGSRYQVTVPTFDEKTGEVIPGKVERFDNCTGKPVALDAKIASTFSGSRRFGVRTANLDWLDPLVKAVNADERRGSKEVGAVQFSASAVDYKVTRATLLDMLLEVQAQARDAATGAESLFASDKKLFRFESATPIGRRPAFEPAFLADIGHPVKRGSPPKVSLTVGYSYTIYAEAGNVIAPTEAVRNGGGWTYPITGTATLEADFAESTITLKTNCHPSAAAATTALAETAESVAEKLRTFHGEGVAATETDRFTQNQPATPSEVFPSPYLPLTWDITAEGFPVKTFLNVCTQEEVPAPEVGKTLPPVFQTSQTLTVRSSRFNDVLELVEKLQSEFDVPATTTDGVNVEIGNAIADATQATKLDLERLAREDAATQAMDGAGQVATDARVFRYTSAFFRGLTEGGFPGVAFEGNAPAFSPLSDVASAESAESAETLEVEVVTVANDERPVHRMIRHYEFRYEVRSENYAALPEWAVARGAQVQQR